ncbi:OmpA family protein [Jannaschia sp. S6380]|uniref:OmpA family protein n=1 Tax=Jannaschia sp. S6380 TaxID=2926408 RepID=UPI001FF5F06D|nr:OmpA family protein [Jannaschia sp. S6380]MCK0168671.1 OmpA family protein [Jannaschia sp. S6380]
MIRALALSFALAGPAGAVDLTMPFPAAATFTESRPLAAHRIATGPFVDTLPVVTVEGGLTRRVWRLDAPEATVLQILAPLRAQLEAEDWRAVFTCADRACGGFDFRFGIDVTPAPAMFVDLADYRYLAMRKGEAWTTLVVSRSGAQGFIQVTRIDPEAEAAPVKSASNPAPPPIPSTGSDIVRALVSSGHAVLADLDFATGSSTLGRSDHASIAALAAFLRDNPGTTVALVGHTDAEGGTQGNMAISRRRAESARALLIERHGIAPGRVEAQGVGYFAPIARNDTPDGRRANRRVEVVITSTE